MAVDAVNRAMRRAIRDDQRSYVAVVKRFEKTQPALFRKTYPYRGSYKTSLTPRLASASSTVVSALIPTTKLLPGGVDGETWISATATVPSGRSVRIQELFSSRRGLAALAALAKGRLVARDPCVRESLRRERALGIDIDARGFAPSPENYSHFALTVKGLVIGFVTEQVAGGSCGAPEVIVPYGPLRAQFSKLGERLVAGVRRPVTS